MNNLTGFLRENGSYGIRNKILIIAVDECADGIAKKCAERSENTIVLTNHYTCMAGGNEETYLQMINVANNPNIYATILLAMGCGSYDLEDMKNEISSLTHNERVYTLNIQNIGGTRKTVVESNQIVDELNNNIKLLNRENMEISDIIVGIKCGGSDYSSGFSSNPCIGRAVDSIIEQGGTCIAGELFELAGCEDIIKHRFKNSHSYEKFVDLLSLEIERWNYKSQGLETMSVGNYIGGLSTIEEKSLGSLYKTGSSTIEDTLIINDKIIELPKENGMYFSDATMLCGGSLTNFAALGVHLVMWSTGSAAVESKITPVITVSGNKSIINEDIDIDVSGIQEGTLNYEQGSIMILEEIKNVINGEKTSLEDYASSFLTLYQKDKRVEFELNESLKYK